MLNVDRIYDEPNLAGVDLSDVQWSPDGRTVSYIRGDGKANEIWGFDVASRRARKLFAFSRLSHSATPKPTPTVWLKLNGSRTGPWRQRRLPLAAMLEYAWAPRGDALLVAANLAQPQVLDLAKDRLTPISRGPVPVMSAQFSPNGRFISFLSGYDLHIVDRTTGIETAITQGSTEALRSASPDAMGDLLVSDGSWWSPDSTRIAYLQTDEQSVPMFPIADLMSKTGAIMWERFPQAGRSNPFIALRVASARGSIWMDTRAWLGWYVARVSWLPNSRYLLLQLLSRDQKTLSLVLADAETGGTRAIHSERDQHWVNVTDDLFFFADGRRFLWSSERDSARHLFIYDVSGRELAQLTSGSEPVVAVDTLDEKQGDVYYLAYPEPYTQARVKRVRFRVKAGRYTVQRPVEVSKAPGSHFAHFSPDASHYASVSSSALKPARLDLHRNDGTHVAVIDANPCKELAAAGLAPFVFGSIPAAKIGDPSDAMPLHYKLIPPKGLKHGERYPVVVYVYGGPLPGAFGLARNVIDYWRAVPELWMQMMAQRGVGVFTIDNRGSNAAARGHAWETPISGRLGHVEHLDQLAGVEFLKGLPWVDADRLGVVGGSFGGFLTLTLMLRSPSTFKAGVAFAPVTDWHQYDSVYTERYMRLPPLNADGYATAALAQYAAGLQGKLLVIHGSSDTNVHVQHSVQMLNALIEASRNFAFMLYPGLDHMSFFDRGQAPARLWQRVTNFFTENL